MNIPSFYETDEFQLIRQKIKIYDCPHCKRSGYLIFHGFIKGYDVLRGITVIKGRRIFCSNRFRKQGCGRTWSIYLSGYIPKFSIDVKTLSNILSGAKNPFKTWKETETGICKTSFYRITNRFIQSTPKIRTQLIVKYKPPPFIEYHLFSTIKHLKSLNINLETALTMFQFTFQVPILH